MNLVQLTNAVNSWGLDISAGVNAEGLMALGCLYEGIGVLSLSASDFEGVATFNGRAEDGIASPNIGSNKRKSG